jgi:hypothetical protein
VGVILECGFPEGCIIRSKKRLRRSSQMSRRNLGFLGEI